jgi:hypothetical protein
MIKMKNFIPCNRHLLVKPITDSQNIPQEEQILLPEEYFKNKTKEETYSLYKIEKLPVNYYLDGAVKHDLGLSFLKEGNLILAQNSMVEKVVTPYGTFHFVAMNYVLAVLEE